MLFGAIGDPNTNNDPQSAVAPRTGAARIGGTNFNRGSRNTYYLDMARKAATKVIEEGPYSLLDNYGDLFAPSTCNNNSEAIFQLQWLQGSTDAIGWGCNNSISTYLAESTMSSKRRLMPPMPLMTFYALTIPTIPPPLVEYYAGSGALTLTETGYKNEM